jgi:LemA protein
MDIALLVAAALSLILGYSYNSLVARRNEVLNAFATIDAMLKQRFDLIPNLVATVKQSTQFETSSLEKVIRLRQEAGSGRLDSAQLQRFDQESQSALKGVMLQFEAYPDLKSSQNFVQLQQSLHAVEEQIAAARRTFNAAVTQYNNAIHMFPSSIVARMMGLRAESVLAIPDSERANVNVGDLFRG